MYSFSCMPELNLEGSTNSQDKKLNIKVAGRLLAKIVHPMTKGPQARFKANVSGIQLMKHLIIIKDEALPYIYKCCL